MIRVLLVDDHSMVRSGLSSLINGTSDLSVVATAADGASALSAADVSDPDVVLMDLSMPGMNGIEATKRLVAAHPEVQVVILTSFSDQDRVLHSLEAGAVGYLLKDVEPDVLLEGIRAVMRGESPLDPRAARALVRSHSSSCTAELTTREREVLDLVRRGMANKQIARALAISERTVKAHLGSIFQRIGVTDRTSAALWAQRNLATVDA